MTNEWELEKILYWQNESNSSTRITSPSYYVQFKPTVYPNQEWENGEKEFADEMGWEYTERFYIDGTGGEMVEVSWEPHWRNNSHLECDAMKKQFRSANTPTLREKMNKFLGLKFVPFGDLESESRDLIREVKKKKKCN